MESKANIVNVNEEKNYFLVSCEVTQTTGGVKIYKSILKGKTPQVGDCLEIWIVMEVFIAFLSLNDETLVVKTEEEIDFLFRAAHEPKAEHYIINGVSKKNTGYEIILEPIDKRQMFLGIFVEDVLLNEKEVEAGDDVILFTLGRFGVTVGMMLNGELLYLKSKEDQHKEVYGV